MTERRTVRFRTRCAGSWDDAWVALVEKTERDRNHPICGARTMAGTPCILRPNHENGRCKFHGGFDTTGAPEGNRNAVTHGLYARGLQRCGRHCPQWEHCPCAGEEVDKLPRHNRPQCPFEATQFQMALTGVKDRLAHVLPCDELDERVAHQTALLEVMVQRAAGALAVSQLHDVTETRTAGTKDAPSRSMYCPKPAVALTAFLRLSAEYRRYLALLERPERCEPSFAEQEEHARRRMHDYLLTPEARSVCEKEGDGRERLAQQELRRAKEALDTALKTEAEANKQLEQWERGDPALDQYDQDDIDWEQAQNREIAENARERARTHYHKAHALCPEICEGFTIDPAPPPPNTEEEPPMDTDEPG